MSDHRECIKCGKPFSEPCASCGEGICHEHGRWNYVGHCCPECNTAILGDKADSAYGEWCRDPGACRFKGYCPLDPACDE